MPKIYTIFLVLTFVMVAGMLILGNIPKDDVSLGFNESDAVYLSECSDCYQGAAGGGWNGGGSGGNSRPSFTVHTRWSFK